jgi:sigma-B regulation protein RsbU (phosphoserine phosphatase)
LLPSESPKLSGCDIHFFWQPAKHVGGDYFDAIRLTDSTAAVCIADVAGKGMPAALLMSNMQASVRGLAHSTTNSAEMCGRLNRVAFENTKSDRFTTLFYGILDSKRRSLRYSNAGHVPPVLIRQDGTSVRLSEGGMVLGVLSNTEYEQVEIDFAAGDRLVLVTDGITEARNKEEEEFGEERLIDFVRRNRLLPAAELQQNLLATVASFAGQALQDDATLMIVSMR